jgi:predicted metal-dependent hydrolase
MNLDAVSYFARGVGLFNQQKFFEAHETWEEIWKKSEGDERIFLQGMIQAAAALLHAARHNGRGALLLFKKCCSKLDRFPAVWMRIDLERFRSDLKLYFDQFRPVPPTGDKLHHQWSQRSGNPQPPTIRWIAD